MPDTLTPEEAKVWNQTWFDKISSRDAVLEKQAVDAVQDFTRTKMREDGFYRRIIPMLPVGNDQLTRTVDDENPVVIVDREPDSPAAITVPFGMLPENLYITGERYKVQFARILTPRFTKDVDQLRTWVMDIRQVLSDNAIKDMLAEEDSKFLFSVNSAMIGPGLTVPTSGVVQWEQIPGGISRDSLHDAFKIMPNTPSNLEVHTVLINNLTIKDIQKFGRDEMGGDLSQDIMKNGWTMSEFMGKTWVITIKKNLVPTSSMYMFADPKFIGKSYELEATSLYIRREAFLLEFFAWETIGGAIGWTSGLARADFV